MQRLAVVTELGAVRSGIAAACYERTRVQMEQHEFRHCPRDERHTKWENELREIETRRTELLRQQAAILKQSRMHIAGTDNGVKAHGLCI